ncbi:MAG: sulfite exporter TauE/SafE family protein [Bacteroidia bacterium]|nr:sulfite exporter TauE/SafE family protein [Bacteroidia bacterium]
MLEITGYICALLVGVILGLLGGGGAILGVPVLVYMLKVDEIQATGYSLFIIGSTSLAGAVNYLRKNPEHKDWILSTVLGFAPSTILTGIIVRKLIQWGLPEIIFSYGDFTFTRNRLIMLFFAAIMMIVAQKMLYASKETKPDIPVAFPKKELLKKGVIVGIVAGIAGSGAGFLITPALVKYIKMPMKVAVGTSLWIISANSWFIFLGDLIVRKQQSLPVDWNLLLLFTGIAVAGIFIGNTISGKISNEKIKQAFGYFVLITGVLVLGIEIVKTFT